MYDTLTQRQQALLVDVSVPPGWLPEDPEGDAASSLGAPEFSSATEFSIVLPTGERRTLNLPI